MDTRLKRVGDVTGKGIFRASSRLAWASAGLLLLMMFFMFSDVFGRYLLNKPILGSSDIGEAMLVLVAFCGMAYTQVEKGHVRVGVLISRLSDRTQAILDTITSLLSAAIFAFIAWEMGVRALGIMISPDPDPISAVLHIPHAPFILLAAIGMTMLCLVLLVDVFRYLGQVARK